MLRLPDDRSTCKSYSEHAVLQLNNAWYTGARNGQISLGTLGNDGEASEVKLQEQLFGRVTGSVTGASVVVLVAVDVVGSDIQRLSAEEVCGGSAVMSGAIDDDTVVPEMAE